MIFKRRPKPTATSPIERLEELVVKHGWNKGVKIAKREKIGRHFRGNGRFIE